MNVTGFFHQFKSLRRLAKIIARKIDIKQKFYSGYIFLNAVEHSWAWTGNRNYNNFDVSIQRFIHEQSNECDLFIDVGCNIGVMTLGTLLTNDKIKTIAIDPNKQSIKLLKKSLIYNKISDRCRTINAVVGNYDGEIIFDSTGSVTGHVSNTGDKVSIIKFSNILNEFKKLKTFVKIDIEGYETEIIDELKNVDNINNFKFVVELHPLGFNEVGNPKYVFNFLKDMNAKISDLDGNELNTVNQDFSTQISIEFV